MTRALSTLAGLAALSGATLLALPGAGVAQPAALTASQPAPQQPVCLQIGQVYDFQNVPGNRALIVTDRFRHKYKLSFMGVCRDMQFNLGLGFKSFGTGQLSCVTRGDQVISREPVGISQHCIINKIEAYTPDMERADAAAMEAAKAK